MYMKKILSLLFVLSFVFLFGCQKGNTTNEGSTTEQTTTQAKPVSFKVMTPNGSPALAQTVVQKNKPSLGNNVSYEVEVVTDASKLAAAMGSKSHEIIFAPINLGAKMYNAAGSYQLAATVVFGNNYIVTGDSSVTALSDLDGKDVILFGENNVPSIVVNELLSYNNINANVSYLASTADTKNALVLDPNKIVLVAEPSVSALSVALKDVSLNVINVQEEWKKMTGNESYPQAAIFVNKEFAQQNHDVVVSYLNAVKEGIEYTNSNVDLVAQMAVDLEYGFPLPVLKNAIPRSNLLYKSASDSKVYVEYLFGKIIASGNATLIGGKLPDEGFFFN